ncbi:MAG: hypothetical protein KIS79_12740 [Burkholderiales bacterium]|nr:hypothetical protein [Burkholderiales bacterium]
MKKQVLVAEVKISEKDGSIHAFSDEIPGLHIVGTNRAEVLEDVMAGIKFLYQKVKGMAVECEWADSPAPEFNRTRPSVERFVMCKAA